MAFCAPYSYAPVHQMQELLRALCPPGLLLLLLHETLPAHVIQQALAVRLRAALALLLSPLRWHVLLKTGQPSSP